MPAFRPTFGSHSLQNSGSTLSVPWILVPLALLILLPSGIFALYHRQPAGENTTAPQVQTTQTAVWPQQTTTAEKPAFSAELLAKTPSIWPASGRITSGFGWRNSPLEEGSELHQGVDIAVSTGTPIVATADGEVVHSGPAGGYGNMVQIRHGNGIETIYGHNSRLAVTVGQTVKKGQIISYAGSTGYSTGPHVHYEVRENGTAVDPMKYLVRY